MSFDDTLVSWQPFFVAQLGAGAALLGLLFVSLSLNLDRILAEPNLPRRAEIGLFLLALQLVVCSIMLIPDQGQVAVGTEVLLLAATVWLATMVLSLRIVRDAASAQRTLAWRNLLMLQLAALPYVAGGLTILLAAPRGLHAVALGMILSFLKAALDAWVLLIEINR